MRGNICRVVRRCLYDKLDELRMYFVALYILTCADEATTCKRKCMDTVNQYLQHKEYTPSSYIAVYMQLLPARTTIQSDEVLLSSSLSRI